MVFVFGIQYASKQNLCFIHFYPIIARVFLSTDIVGVCIAGCHSAGDGGVPGGGSATHACQEPQGHDAALQEINSIGTLRGFRGTYHRYGQNSSAPQGITAHLKDPGEI